MHSRVSTLHATLHCTLLTVKSCLGLVNHCLSFALYLCALVHQIASCLMLQVAHCAAKSIISRALRPMDTGSTSMLWEGARVRVHSLVGAPRYNGLQGKAGAFTASTGRWSVRTAVDCRKCPKHGRAHNPECSFSEADCQPDTIETGVAAREGDAGALIAALISASGAVCDALCIWNLRLNYREPE